MLLDHAACEPQDLHNNLKDELTCKDARAIWRAVRAPGAALKGAVRLRCLCGRQGRLHQAGSACCDACDEKWLRLTSCWLFYVRVC